MYALYSVVSLIIVGMNFSGLSKFSFEDTKTMNNCYISKMTNKTKYFYQHLILWIN